MMKRTLLTFVIIGLLHAAPALSQAPCVIFSNNSVPTLCAEEDNVNIPLHGMPSTFAIEATHPQYTVTAYSCLPDFTNCSPASGDDYEFTPAQLKLYDNGTWVVWAYRQAAWWQPQGMTAFRFGGPALEDAHYIAVSKKVTGESSWPQFLVLYCDGNLRLIPHPPAGQASVCFGASVIIGPAAISDRPVAQISSVGYQPSDNTLTLTYRQAGSATLSMEVDRTKALITVDVNYPTDELPFTTFRSMFVNEGNSDTAKVAFRDDGVVASDYYILDADPGSADQFVFYRQIPSIHNAGAPDITIGPFFRELNADLNGDSRVDLLDFSRLADNWMRSRCCICGGANIDCDSGVDYADLACLLDHWLAGI